ncbi:MAG: UDP-N-acetylmuramoyl-L-alanine--D-glutamate ligase [Candidatus Sungiibacteriota bacterium]|uniref:UDP-N-acetylmuramoylalanine--D-glutamate ligase n=1 Tax=Candidatus Sungiibacteriota bacterium TaxID=2750080 RepID=A0A7T5RJG7_9BACT|nr:MAG: UDP-N-acetylmuramoyl-L-alanine--D-glutamate ligase [Candidatus Sungbacteria bacterium]
MSESKFTNFKNKSPHLPSGVLDPAGRISTTPIHPRSKGSLTSQAAGILGRWGDKRVLVMGLGLHDGGVGTVKFLARAGAQVTVTDLRPRRILTPALDKLRGLKNVRYILGKHRKKDFIGHDLIVKNPGVQPNSPYLKLAKKHRIPITSDMGLFFGACPAKIIGITGTRGKSTTAHLIWKFLKTGFARVYLGGNIRKSVLDFLPHLKRNDLVVLELSSFQLKDLARQKKSPHIAVLTNIFRDHLNWHRGFRDYLQSKSIIFKFQGKKDYLFANTKDKIVRGLAKSAHSHVVFPRLPKHLRLIVDKKLGSQFRESTALAIAVARHFKISPSRIEKILRSFRGLPGRQKHIGRVKGINFINDTTSTIPEAAMAAIKRFRMRAPRPRKLILIAGGSDKKLDFHGLAAMIKKNADIVIFLPGTATDKIVQLIKVKTWHQGLTPMEAKSMSDAVRKAYRLAQYGDYIVLSPGAASFGLFLNEFDRGDQFVKEVQKLKHDGKRR